MVECVQKMHEPVQVHRYLAVPKCGTATSENTSEAESGYEAECEEEKEDTAEFRAPIELLAEVGMFMLITLL